MWMRQTRRRSGSTNRWASPTTAPTLCSGTHDVGRTDVGRADVGRTDVRGRAQPEHPVELLVGQRLVTGRHGTQHLGVQLDLIQRDPVVNAEINLLGHRVHLQPKWPADMFPSGYVGSSPARMTHRDHLRAILV